MKFYDNQNNRLVFFIKNLDMSRFWDQHWLKNKMHLRETVLKYNPKSMVCKISSKFLDPNKGPILEGGCGLGTHVYSLQQIGFNVIGIDNAKNTIETINEFIPEINVFHGDVRAIRFDDGYFAAYWSIGVIEHFFEGFNEIALEMKRVIKKNGFLFLSFPYMSLFRRFKAKTNFYPSFYPENVSSDQFYQFALDENLVVSHFEKLGFKLKFLYPYGGIKGFQNEIFFCKFFLKRFLKLMYKTNKPEFIRKIKRILDRFLIKFSAHMILLVFQKL